MKYQIITLLATLLAVAQAAPTTPIEKSPLEKRNSVNDCGDSTFENQSSGGSPLVSDCQQINRNIAGGGTWTTGAGGEQRTLVTYGTCAFGVMGSRDLGTFNVGNQDIIDVINSSIDRFNFNGLVGAKGKMYCQGSSGYPDQSMGVYWGLYHT